MTHEQEGDDRRREMKVGRLSLYTPVDNGSLDLPWKRHDTAPLLVHVTAGRTCGREDSDSSKEEDLAV